jgi:hypothetical protein
MPATSVAVGFWDCDRHYASQTIPMESANSREIISQRFTVAPFESLAELVESFAYDMFALPEFHDCSFVSGASCPLTNQRGAKARSPELEGRDWCVHVGTGGVLLTSQNCISTPLDRTLPSAGV